MYKMKLNTNTTIFATTSLLLIIISGEIWPILEAVKLPGVIYIYITPVTL